MRSSPTFGREPLLLCCILLAGLTSFTPLAHADFQAVELTGGTYPGPVQGFLMADLNQDGALDILLNSGNGDTPNDSHLYFQENGSWTEVTETHAAGLTTRLAEWRDALAVDLNHDGFVDIVRAGQGPTDSIVEIYYGKGPAGTPKYGFGDADTTPNVTVDLPFEYDLDGLGVLDYDDDGYLDLVLGVRGLQILSNPGKGEGNWELVVMGPTNLTPPNTDPADSISLVDLNGDQLVDLIQPIDRFPDVWINQGDGSFEAAASAPDFSLPPGGQPRAGSIVCDFDGDGLLDLYRFGAGVDESPLAGASENIYLQRDTAWVFADQPPSAVGVSTLVTGGVCGDFDNDGDQDLFVTVNGADALFVNESSETNLLFVRDDRGIADSETTLGRGAVASDYDLDGDLDLVVANDASGAIWQNDVNNGGENNYLQVRVLADVSTCGQPPLLQHAFGATVRIPGIGAQHLSAGSGTRAFQVDVLHFGLPQGPNQDYEVSVAYPDPLEPVHTRQVRPSDLGELQRFDFKQDLDLDDDTIENRNEVLDTNRLPVPNDDVDGDGVVNWLDSDSDGDGALDIVEAGDRDPCTPAADTDGNGIPDYLEAAVVNVPVFTAEGSGCTCAVAQTRRIAPAGVLLLGLAMLVITRRRRD